MAPPTFSIVSTREMAMNKIVEAFKASASSLSGPVSSPAAGSPSTAAVVLHGAELCMLRGCAAVAKVGQQHGSATMRQGLPIMRRPESTPAVIVTAGLTLCVSCHLQEQRQRLLESISSKVRSQPCLLRGAASACAHITNMRDIPRCIITCCDMSNTQYNTCYELCCGFGSTQELVCAAGLQ
jgi:hypothetical protein